MSATTDDLEEAVYFQTRQTSESILELFSETRSWTERLCQSLATEDYVVQSMEDASPTKWHLAHTSWFFETFVLAQFNQDYRSPFPQHDYLFNSYYLQAGERYPRPQRGLLTRPTVSEVQEYRRYVSKKIVELLRGTDRMRVEQFVPIVEIGVHHEQQHQELILTDLKHLLSFNPLYPIYAKREVSSTGSVPEMKWLCFDEGLHWIGHDGKGFCFDNEKPHHREFVESFQLAGRLVTNSEYIAFMEDGGYENPTLWLSEGWATVEEKGWKAPLYWHMRNGEWHYFTQSGLRKVNPAEPVCHVSQFEADAFARWGGARLPTEVEWEIAAAGKTTIDGNFAENETFHPVALADKSPDGEPRQIYGDVWEWTQSPYTPYPGFRSVEGALGEYNGKFMSNQMVLRGGSCVTPRAHIRRTYRNFFPSAARWQFAGIRLARGV